MSHKIYGMHLVILEAVRNSDPDATEIAMFRHMNAFREDLDKAYSGTAAACTAVAASIAGTVPYACAVRRSSGFLIAHPAGYMEVEVAVEETRGAIRIETAAFGRTARRLMAGYVYLK